MLWKNKEASHVRSVLCVCVCLYIAIGPPVVGRMWLTPTVSTVPSPPRTLVKMAICRSLFGTTSHDTSQCTTGTWTPCPRLPTTLHDAAPGTTGSLTMCCLFLATTMEKWIYSKCLPSCRSKCYWVQQLFFRAWGCRYFLTYAKTETFFSFFQLVLKRQRWAGNSFTALFLPEFLQ